MKVFKRVEGCDNKTNCTPFCGKVLSYAKGGIDLEFACKPGQEVEIDSSEASLSDSTNTTADATVSTDGTGASNTSEGSARLLEERYLASFSVENKNAETIESGLDSEATFEEDPAGAAAENPTPTDNHASSLKSAIVLITLGIFLIISLFV